MRDLLETWRLAEPSFAFDAFIDVLLEEATRGPLEVAWAEGGALRVGSLDDPTRHVDIARGARALRTLCARIAIRLGEENAVQPPLYGGRGALRAPDGTTIDVELSNQQRTGYWIRLRLGPAAAG